VITPSLVVKIHQLAHALVAHLGQLRGNHGEISGLGHTRLMQMLFVPWRGVPLVDVKKSENSHRRRIY
jgi:hypothetical protein